MRLRLMAAIVALRKQVVARASDYGLSAKPPPCSAAVANNVHRIHDLPYLQLQTKPGGTTVQQRDISSFFRCPPVPASSDDTEESVTFFFFNR